jgi:glycosyltransferase involved in cell wall biosynthesis
MTFANGETLARKTQALCSRTRTRPLYLGIDTNRFVPANRSTTNVNIICTRRFEPLYNNQYLIDGLARLPRCRADVTTTFASYGELLPAAKEYARQRLSPQMFARMHFLGGTSLENLVERLASADIYVSLSWSDGTSISLLEAMACGAFPILSDIPQNREWIDPARNNGILVPFNKPDVLAEALATAIDTPGLRAQSAETNRNLIIEKADSSRNMAVLSRALEEIAAAA